MNKSTTYLFDCDGLLVDSEPLAFRGCCSVVNRVLTDKGVDLEFTPETLLARFVGQSFRGMITALAGEHGFTFAEGELDKLVKDEEDAVIATLEAELLPTPGMNDVLTRLDGKPRAVVSSSALRRVKVSLKKAGQESFFNPDHVFSATSSLPTPTTKPDPAIYLFALEKLGVKAEDSIAFEDSKSGVKAAVGAGIPTVGYVGSLPEAERDERVAVLTENGALVVIRDWSEFDSAVAAVAEKLAQRKAS